MKNRKWLITCIVAVSLITSGAVLFFLLNFNKLRSKEKPTTAEHTVVVNTLLPLALKQSKPYIPERFVKEIVEECIKTRFRELILALVTVESHFDIFARSKAGAYSCTQIRWSKWKDELVKNGIVKSFRELFDPKNCVRAGEYILEKYYRETKDIRKALIRYNCGYKKECKKGEKFAEEVLSVFAEYKLAKGGVR